MKVEYKRRDSKETGIFMLFTLYIPSFSPRLVLWLIGRRNNESNLNGKMIIICHNIDRHYLTNKPATVKPGTTTVTMTVK